MRGRIGYGLQRKQILFVVMLEARWHSGRMVLTADVGLGVATGLPGVVQIPRGLTKSIGPPSGAAANHTKPDQTWNLKTSSVK